MDALYSREVGPSYVPAFAARLVLAMGKGVQRAGGEPKQSLTEDFERLWVLAMVVVQWYAEALPPAEAKAIASALQEFELGPLASNLNLFRERLLPFVRTAYEAKEEAQLAAAGAYFVAAVDQIGVRMLSAAMNAAPLQAVKARILSRLPPPASIKESFERTLGVAQAKPMAPAKAPQKAPDTGTSRADRFDRADFVQRPVPARARALPRTEEPPREPPSRATPPRPPDPRLDEATVTQAFLFTLGWEGAEVERIIAGPDGKSPRPRTVRGKRIA